MFTLVEKDRVYIAYSLSLATRVSDLFLSEQDMLNKNNLFVWHVKGHKNTIMAGNMMMRYNDVIKYDDKIIKCRKIDYCSIVNKIAPNIQEKLRDNNGLNDEGNTRNIYYIAQDNRAFYINNDINVEIEDYHTSGYYSNITEAGLEKYKDLPAYERIYNTCKDIEKLTNEKILPIVVMDTLSDKAKAIFIDGSIKTL